MYLVVFFAVGEMRDVGVNVSQALPTRGRSSISSIFGVHKVRSCAYIPIYFLPDVLITSFRAHYR